MVVLVGMCLTLLTVPPLPEPRSLMISRSSGRRSRLNSIPISSCADVSSDWLFLEWLKLAFSAVGGGLGAAGVRARPLTFLRFIERGANGSAIVTIMVGVDLNMMLFSGYPRPLCDRLKAVVGALVGRGCRNSRGRFGRGARRMCQTKFRRLSYRAMPSCSAVLGLHLQRPR